VSEQYADPRHRYRLDSRIATGGMGEVWRAHDTTLDREVAIKLLKREYADDPVFRSRFAAEAKHAALLSHPGIAAVFDVGDTPQPDGTLRPYLVMELVDGRPLSDLLRRGQALDPEAVRQILVMTADALAAAHRAGIVHRDIKPANLMITHDRKVKITDFGISRAASGAAITNAGEVMGTPQYLSPEQARGDRVTPASDVYGLGVVAYECLAGRRPFDKETSVATALAHLHEEPPPLPDTVPADLRAVVMQAMAKDPAQRYPEAGAFAAALRGGATAPGMPVPADPSAEATTQVIAPAAAEPAPASTQVLTGVVPAAGGLPPEVPPPGQEEPEEGGRGKRRTWWLWLLGLLLVGLIAWLLMGLFGGDSSDDDPFVPVRSSTTPQPSRTPEPTETTPSPDEPETFSIDEGDYLGRDVDEVLAELRDLGLDPVTTRVDNDGSEDPESVAGVSPTTDLEEGDVVEVRFYDFPPEPEPTPDEPSEQPSEEPDQPEEETSQAPSEEPSSEAPTDDETGQSGTGQGETGASDSGAGSQTGSPSSPVTPNSTARKDLGR